jgi:predicted enzyme related to lactoylglutathione lyase
MTRTTGTTTYFDLSTTDLAAASAFYSGLFGWDFEDTGEEFGHYTMLSNGPLGQGGTLVGGAMDVAGMSCEEGGTIEPSWGVYLAVEDLDARLAKATDHGATVPVPAMDIGPAGRMAMILDPAGADVCLWQAGDTEGSAFTGAAGSPVWSELMTDQYDESQAFYTEVFGAVFTPMAEEMQTGDEPFRYVTNNVDGEPNWGLCDLTQMPGPDTGWRIYFGVDSCDAAVARVKELGGKVLDGPYDSPFGRIASIEDPTGASFQISAMSETKADAR